jgi:hypothetical protein
MQAIIYSAGRRTEDIMDLSLLFRPASEDRPFVLLRYRQPPEPRSFTCETGPFAYDVLAVILRVAGDDQRAVGNFLLADRMRDMSIWCLDTWSAAPAT